MVLLLAACQSAPSEMPAPPSATAPIPLTLTSVASPTPYVPPPPTIPPPTLDPAVVAATITSGEAQIAAAGVDPLCLRREDADNDGVLEWVGLYMRPTDPPELAGFVLDQETWYDLQPPPSEEARGLGAYPTCELEVRDLNADGQVEIAVRGHAGTSTGFIHIFAWNGTHYAVLGAFEGRGGARMEDADGDLSPEVIVRLRPEGDLVWEIVYTWDGTHYAWTWDRYAWYYMDRPHVYVDDTPQHAMASFYLALNDRDLPGAFSLLSPTAQTARSFDAWAQGFTTTVGAEVGALRLVSQDGGWARVAAQVQALDNVSGRVMVTLYAVEWQLVQTEAGWRLENGTTQILDEWELVYYP